MLKKLFLSLIICCFTHFLFAQKTLHIYGGEDHDVYLGCLNCSNIDQNSVWNDIGQYGSNISSISIWNDIGTYGSDVSSYSPWNELASYPPVIVDKDGGFYGYFTVNEYKPKRATFSLVMTLYKYHDLIKDDVEKWYDKIFN